MEINVRIVRVMEVITGSSSGREWKKREFLGETDGQYPKKILFGLWGDKVEDPNLKEGNQVTVSFDLESREYNGRFYTDVKAYRISGAKENQFSAPSNMGSSMPEPSAPPLSSTEADDDLPF